MARDLVRRPALFVPLLLACAVAPEERGYTRGTAFHGDERIGQYVSGEFSLSTASYWIEGPEGLVLIDTQFMPSATRKAHDFAELQSGKRSKLALVLDAAPDRFDGTGFLRSVGVPVMTSAQVRAAIPDAHARWSPVLFEQFHVAQYSRELVLPESFGDETRKLGAGGLSLTAHVLGPGTAPAHVVVEWEGHLFTGNLVANGSHAWFEEGDLPGWMERLAELRALGPRFVHPGRGKTGGPELIDQQLAYARAVQELIAAEKPSGEMTAAKLQGLKGRVVDRFPNHAHPQFLPALLRTEWRRQVAKAATARVAPR